VKTWLYRLGYLSAALVILGLEIAAIVNNDKGDTISEGVWLVVFSHPLVWLVTLGASGGLAIWLGRHFWGKKR